MKCYRMSKPSEVDKVGNWIVSQQQLHNETVTLCWTCHQKATLDHLKLMFEKRLSSICIVEDDLGTIKAVIYFQCYDEQDIKVYVKSASYAVAVIDSTEWAQEKMEYFKELLKLCYSYMYSQSVFHADFWVLKKIFEAHQQVFFPEFLKVIQEHDEPPWGKTVRFQVDVKGAIEKLTAQGSP